MTIDRDTALGLWDSIYGKNNKWQKDAFGTYMYRDDYGERDLKRLRPNGTGKYYNYGWEIDHIRPTASYSSEKASTYKNNLEPMHHVHNREKADNYPDFEIDGKKYRVVECEICKRHGLKGYGILDVANNVRVDTKFRRKIYHTS